MEIGIDSITAWISKDDIRMRRRLRKTCKTQNSWGCLAGESKNWIWSLDFDTSCHHRSGACDISNFSSKRRAEVLCCDTPHVCNTCRSGRLSFSSGLVTTPILAFKHTTNSMTRHHSTSGLGWESSIFGTYTKGKSLLCSVHHFYRFWKVKNICDFENKLTAMTIHKNCDVMMRATANNDYLWSLFASETSDCDWRLRTICLAQGY